MISHFSFINIEPVPNAVSDKNPVFFELLWIQNQIILHKTHVSKNNTSASSFDSNNICTTQSYLTLFEKFQTAILPHLG